MTGLTVDIPVLETDRLTLRPPRMDDTEPFMAFLDTERSRFVGGPNVPQRYSMRAFGHVAGLWVLRGYSCFVATLRSSDEPIGMMGPYYPLVWPELEFSWSLWSPEAEGKGLVTEAMRRVIPWAWERCGTDTAISIVDAENAASARVAEALGAVPDADATEAMTRPTSPLYDPKDTSPLTVYRHRKGALR